LFSFTGCSALFDWVVFDATTGAGGNLSGGTREFDDVALLGIGGGTTGTVSKRSLGLLACDDVARLFCSLGCDEVAGAAMTDFVGALVIP
jgi:hypothetical protein